jgi:hypothetical protein
MSKYRAGGCVAPPIAGTMERWGKPTNSHIVSQHEHGLHERDDPLPPEATANGWKK